MSLDDAKLRIRKAIKNEWEAGFNNTPGLHHQSEDVIKKYLDALLPANIVEALQWCYERVPHPEPHTREVSRRTEMLDIICAILREEDGFLDVM